MEPTTSAVNALPGSAGAIRLGSVRPERFKATFKPQPIPLGAFNVIIGRNGSGKSSLLEALQWLDTAIRRDAREACDRYFGVGDLVNLRSQTEVPYFKIASDWVPWEFDDDFQSGAHYSVTVSEIDGLPTVTDESLTAGSNRWQRTLISTVDNTRFIGPESKQLRIFDPDRLALARVAETELDDPLVGAVSNFWSRAVFLRLSPNRLAQGSQAVRRSFDPILDEEGQQLPALLRELTEDQLEDLARDIGEILPGIRDVKVSESGVGRDRRANYSLLERMPYRGRAGRNQFPIPSWMLSEGTRRITALLALLKREPSPSVICIEEIENGLDPWSVQMIIMQLQDAAARGVQIILTTHSPWLLDHVPLDTIVLVRRLEGDTQYQRFADVEEVQKFDPSLPAGIRYSNLESGR